MSLEENLAVLQALPSTAESVARHSEAVVHASQLRAAEITFETIMDGFTNGTFSWESEHDRDMYEQAVARVQELRSKNEPCPHDEIAMTDAGPKCILCGAS